MKILDEILSNLDAQLARKRHLRADRHLIRGLELARENVAATIKDAASSGQAALASERRQPVDPVGV